MVVDCRDILALRAFSFACARVPHLPLLYPRYPCRHSLPPAQPSPCLAFLMLPLGYDRPAVPVPYPLLYRPSRPLTLLPPPHLRAGRSDRDRCCRTGGGVGLYGPVIPLPAGIFLSPWSRFVGWFNPNACPQLLPTGNQYLVLFSGIVEPVVCGITIQAGVFVVTPGITLPATCSGSVWCGVGTGTTAPAPQTCMPPTLCVSQFRHPRQPAHYLTGSRRDHCPLHLPARPCLLPYPTPLPHHCASHCIVVLSQPDVCDLLTVT